MLTYRHTWKEESKKAVAKSIALSQFQYKLKKAILNSNTVKKINDGSISCAS